MKILRQYWPTLLTVSYCLVAAGTLLVDRQPLSMALDLALLPLMIVIYVFPFPEQESMLRKVHTGFDFPVNIETLSVVGWFVASAILITLVFLVNSSIVGLLRTRTLKKAAKRPPQARSEFRPDSQ
jgi:hypothetical protein